MCLINEAHTVGTKHQQDLIEMLQCQAKCQITDHLWDVFYCANASQANTLLLSLMATSCLPPLGNAEHTLFNKHDGCTKC